MAVNRDSTRHGYPLPCGRDVEDVWADLEAGRSGDHPASCPHCATARTGLEQLAAATRLLVSDPAEPPPGLLDQIMDAVRADLHAGDGIALPDPDDPGTPSGVEISTSALAAVLRFAVDGIEGMRAHRCRIDTDDQVPYAVRVWLTVSLRYGVGQVSAIAQVRRRVRAALSERIGVALRGLDVEVTDIWVGDELRGGHPR